MAQHSVMNFANGDLYQFTGGRFCGQDDFTRNFHLTPTRLSFGLHKTGSLPGENFLHPFIYFGDKRIVILDSASPLSPRSQSFDVDILVLSHNARVRISLVEQAFNPKQYIFDASSAAWKIRQWKNECDSLHLRRHSVQENGAFILDF